MRVCDSLRSDVKEWFKELETGGSVKEGVCVWSEVSGWKEICTDALCAQDQGNS